MNLFWDAGIKGNPYASDVLTTLERFVIKKKGLLSFVWVNFHKSGKKAVNILSLRYT